ncbi:MAG TPA: glutamate-5-semialdehyde dehydrogenase [Lentisphaeria bacterium]|nr:glutamate-5-semialdehyde dehydrogenase [Lentisphaeria bacterium]HCG50827.1 glutamate-5-semialdehyde dehydrogenase [Lentisphaeria bacterium]
MKAKLLEMGECARNASRKIANASPELKNGWLTAMADALEKDAEKLIAANEVDMKNGAAKGLSSAMLDRLKLDPKRVKAMADGLRHVVTLPDPAGEILSTTTRPNGIRIDKVSVPLGVIGFIYESRPNVTVDAAGLCLKAGNAVILRGGSEAIHSNQALADCIIAAGKSKGMPDGVIQLVPFTDHAAVSLLLKMDQYINLVIPRGGERLIRAVVEQSTIPVIKHYKGVCHLYVDADADPEMALNIIRNGKCQRPGVCNALEKVLIHEKIAPDFVLLLGGMFKKEGVQVIGDCAYCKLDNAATPATEEDWSREYLDLIISAKIVPSLEAAVDHINRYSSGHSDAIITKNEKNARYFLDNVDSATVYWNASTRFTDGGEFGMGAEIGISTDKLHARGPMGLRELTSYKYKIYGDGQIRS